MSARGAHARSNRTLVVGRQVNRDGLGVVEAVVPRHDIGVSDDVARATLRSPPVLKLTQAEAQAVVVPTITEPLIGTVINDITVEPQATAGIVNSKARNGGLVADLQVEGRTDDIPEVHVHAFQNRSLRVDAEVVGDGLLGGRGPVVAGGNRQLVRAIGQVLELVGRQVQSPGRMALLHRSHDPIRVQGGLPVLVRRVRGDDLASRVREGCRHRVNGTQGSRSREHGMGRIHRISAGDHVIPGVGATLTLCHIVEGVVAQRTAVRPVVDARGQNVPIALRGELVKDRGLTPVAVEAQVGHGQIRLTLRARREAHEALQEGTRRRIVCHVLGERGSGGDVDADGGLALRGHSDGRALAGGRGSTGVSNLHALATPIGGALTEEAVRHDVGKRLRVHLIGRRSVGQVVQDDVEVPALRAIPQVGLGAGGLGGTLHGRVHRRGRSSQNVHQAGSLLTRRVVGAGVLERIDDGGGCAHDEVLDDVHLLAITHRGEERIVLNTFKHDGAHADDLRRRHGRAGHEPVCAVRHRGIDVAAGGSHLGLEPQIRGDAPRTEAGH